MKGQGLMIWLMRLAIGSIFIYSGITKGIDPFGTLYKFREYFAALNMWIPDSVLLTGVIALCSFEFLIGVFLILGCYRKSAPLLALIFMVLMLLLTGWILIADPVSDCGCFGDSLVLSNSATFIKNIFILAGVFWLVKFNKEGNCLITPYLQWMAFLGSGAYIVIISLYGYEVQPLVDFRPFPIGTSVLAEDDNNDEAEELTFVYTRGDEKIEIKAGDPIPSEEEGWKFTKRIQNNNIKFIANQPKATEFSIYTLGEEEEDVTYDLIPGEEILLVLAPELERVSKSDAWKIETLADEASEEGINFAFIVAASDDLAEIWKDLLNTSVDIYKGEDTVIKMIARGNPAVVLINDGKIMWKSTLRSLPLENVTKNWIRDYQRDDKDVLIVTTSTFIGWLAFLVFLSYLRPLFLMRRKGARKTDLS